MKTPIYNFSVSLVYTKSEPNYNLSTTISTSLKVVIVRAISEDEALGKAINYYEVESKGYLLLLKSVVKIIPNKIK